MKRELICGAAIGAITVALTAFNAMAESYTITGTVTGVEPVYRTKTVTTPVQKCWTEEVPVYGYTEGKKDPTGDMLTGAIIGGIIGNNLKGEKGGGAAGAVLGGILGHQNATKGEQVITGYRTVNKCATHYDDVTEEYLAGYKIQYEALGLKGTISSSRNRSVGDSIRVNVNINAY